MPDKPPSARTRLYQPLNLTDGSGQAKSSPTGHTCRTTRICTCAPCPQTRLDRLKCDSLEHRLQPAPEAPPCPKLVKESNHAPSDPRQTGVDILRPVATESRRTPLHPAHLKLGGRMVEFAGYDMPVQYKGVIAESKAVRAAAGMFDVSHMARLKFTGGRVLEFLELVTANDVAALGDMRGQYSMLPNESGGLVDDIILYHMNEGEYRMVVNAANHEKDVAHLKKHNDHGVEIEDYSDKTAMIAVQGPKAAEIVAGLSDDPEAITGSSFFDIVETTVAGADCFCARSGYTGEDGYELICPAAEALDLWDALVGAGVEPCGLGARDVLRLEAGLPLYGLELTDDMSPIAAQLGWAIGKEKSFLGSDHINRAREEGVPQKLRGIRFDAKRLPVPGMRVLVGGEQVGQLCSGVFSPTLDCGLAMAYLDSSVKLKTPCEVDVRGRLQPAMVVSKRFYKRS